MDGWKVGDLPGNQMVNIVLNRCMTLHDGSISLTSHLVSDGEVDYAVDQLIKELEAVRRKAKDKIKNDTRKIRNSLRGSVANGCSSDSIKVSLLARSE